MAFSSSLVFKTLENRRPSYTLNLVTVVEASYGFQQDAVKGLNPKR